MTGPAIVSNASAAPVTVALNTIPAYSVKAVTLAAGDADGLLAAGCVVSPTVSGRAQDAAYLLTKVPGGG